MTQRIKKICLTFLQFSLLWMALTGPHLITGWVYHELLCRDSEVERWGAWPGVRTVWKESAHWLSGTVRAVWYTGRPHCQPHNRISSAQHCRNCWPINLNAMRSLSSCLRRLISSLQQIQRATLFLHGGFRGRSHLQTGVLNFLYIIAPCGYHTPKSQIPNNCSHCSFQWPDASQIKSTLLSNDNKRSLLIRDGDFWRSGVLKDVITMLSTEHVPG